MLCLENRFGEGDGEMEAQTASKQTLLMSRKAVTWRGPDLSSDSGGDTGHVEGRGEAEPSDGLKVEQKEQGWVSDS